MPSFPTKLRARIGWRLRCFADRVDPDNGPGGMSYSFTFELGEGIRFRDDGRGCPLWYLGAADYQRAHDEADKPAPQIDWKTMTLLNPGVLRHPPA